MGDSGFVNFDEMVDIKQSGQEVDIQSDKLTSLKPLHITSLSFPEGSIDLVNYGGACVNNPSSCIDASVSAIGPSSVLSENVAVNEVLRAEYASSGFPS